ncbi:hypothetical protein EKE94_00590 [Mesobaculum littorinae]|uniref:Uncharacterized protein n=2 Tax=Mesobaculum littorinae TaxID=2486419 RepID=A0A438AMT9_9RHOB|nr:hypothetical protein EKE94_00590 [Mesobaculum littorinae]
MAAPTDRLLRVMPREMRLMSERILSLSAMPKGFFSALCDVVMYSQGAGLGGFDRLLADIETVKAADPAALMLRERVLDVGGQHAWIAVPSALDLLGEVDAPLTILNATAEEELAVIAALGPRLGLQVTAHPVAGGLCLSATRAAPVDPLLDRLMQDGAAIPEALWWRVWALAQTALMPDSEVSRRHAGPVIVTPDGRLIGRTDNDDDTDPGFIRGGRGTAEAKA